MTDSTSKDDQTKTPESSQQIEESSPQWEYKVIHINMNQVKTEDLPKPANPEVASQKLQGSLSPEFIKKQFPTVYKNNPKAAQPRHPAEQLQDFLNTMGRDCWELIEISELGPLQMFFFKRPSRLAVAQTSAQESEDKACKKDSKDTDKP